ncbi:MAG: RsbRD N-terminal domain-containing protein [Desulfamplus sp.]|nr:RsbRD N-terminal domain-containing protein [Desulfamplus sp.]
MDINQQLELKKEEILKKWFESAINSYPEDTAKFLKKSKNQFDNPVGSATLQSLENTFRDILEMKISKNYKYSQDIVEQNKIENALDPIIRIRAVQNFSASEAVAFVFELKNIVKSTIGKLNDQNSLEEFRGSSSNSVISSYELFEHKVDLVALAAFNRFMKCRENIFLLKATEAKRRIHSAFERAGLVTELNENELVGSSKS